MAAEELFCTFQEKRSDPRVCGQPALYSNGQKHSCIAHVCLRCPPGSKANPRMPSVKYCSPCSKAQPSQPALAEPPQLEPAQAQAVFDAAVQRILASVRASIAQHRAKRQYEAPVRVDLSEPFAQAGPAFLMTVIAAVHDQLLPEHVLDAACTHDAPGVLILEGKVTWYPLSDAAFDWASLLQKK